MVSDVIGEVVLGRRDGLADRAHVFGVFGWLCRFVLGALSCLVVEVLLGAVVVVLGRAHDLLLKHFVHELAQVVATNNRLFVLRTAFRLSRRFVVVFVAFARIVVQVVFRFDVIRLDVIALMARFKSQRRIRIGA